MFHNSGYKLAALGACIVTLIATTAKAQTVTTPAVLQVLTVSANAPDATRQVVQGQVYYDPNTQTVGYCLADPDPQVSTACATANVSSIVTANDSGTPGGRAFDARVDAGSLGSTVSNGHSTPELKPLLFITRVATADESFDGYFAFPLTIALDKTGHFVPMIGNNF